MPPAIVYEDEYGEVIDRPEQDFIEIRWFDATARFTSDQFNNWLAEFASAVEAAGRAGALVDGIAFHMHPSQMDGPWRDANIIPRYNAAGVRRFAFLMPAGMPSIGTEPAVEGPGNFPTGYFGTRAEAIAWLQGPELP